MCLVPQGWHADHLSDGVIFRATPYDWRCVGPVMHLHDVLLGSLLVWKEKDPRAIGGVPVVGVWILGYLGAQDALLRMQP